MAWFLLLVSLSLFLFGLANFWLTVSEYRPGFNFLLNILYAAGSVTLAALFFAHFLERL